MDNKHQYFSFFDIDVTKASTHRLTPCYIAAHYLWHFRDFALYSEAEFAYIKNNLLKNIKRNHHPYREHVLRLMEIKDKRLLVRGDYPVGMLTRLEMEYLNYNMSQPNKEEQKVDSYALSYM